jgi:hypothetical protein
VTITVYPLLQCYAEIPLRKEDAAEQERNFKLDRTRLGKETIDGHACVKNKVVLTDDQGKKQESIVWNASDQKDFPIQLQMAVQDDTVLFRFRDVKLNRPDPKLFDPPAGFTKYDSDDSLKKHLDAQK